MSWNTRQIIINIGKKPHIVAYILFAVNGHLTTHLIDWVNDTVVLTSDVLGVTANVTLFGVVSAVAGVVTILSVVFVSVVVSCGRSDAVL